jgi:hypothetical protein
VYSLNSLLDTPDSFVRIKVWSAIRKVFHLAE